MAHFSAYALLVSGFVILTVSSKQTENLKLQKHTKHVKNAGEMNKMAEFGKKMMDKKDEHARTTREDGSLRDFCRKFDKANEKHLAEDFRSVEDLRSACEGRCSDCVDCPEGCRNRVAKGCKGILKNKISIQKNSPVKELCNKFNG